MNRFFLLVGLILGGVAGLFYAKAPPGRNVPMAFDSPLGRPAGFMEADRLDLGLTAMAELGALAVPQGKTQVLLPGGVQLDGRARLWWWNDASSSAVAVLTVNDGDALRGWLKSITGTSSDEQIGLGDDRVYRTGDLLLLVRDGQGYIATSWPALHAGLGSMAPGAVTEARPGIRGTIGGLGGDGSPGGGAGGIDFTLNRDESAWQVRIEGTDRFFPPGGDVYAGQALPTEGLRGAAVIPLAEETAGRVGMLLLGLASQTNDPVTANAVAELWPLLANEFSLGVYENESGGIEYAAAVGVDDESAAQAWLERWFGIAPSGEDGAIRPMHLGTRGWVTAEDGRIWVATNREWLAAWRDRAAVMEGEEAEMRGAGGLTVFADETVLPVVAGPLHASSHRQLRWLGRMLGRLERVEWVRPDSPGAGVVELRLVLRPDHVTEAPVP